MIEISHLTKVYGDKAAVNDVSFTVQPGMVTGFLGPNGAGKSTTMRILMGLENPSSGTATVLGKPLREHDAPLRSVGALLDARSLHPARKARVSLLALADSNGLPASRVDEVLELTGLTGVADRRSGGYSLGMGQRLGIAAALLGDPQVLVFDEPVNGLDPEGVTWVRRLCRDLAAEGRTVLISSHLMSEMAQTADRIVVIGRGRLLADATLDEFVGRMGDEHVRVATPDTVRLGDALHANGTQVNRLSDHSLQVRGINAAQVGQIAFDLGVRLEELTHVKPSLEEAYMRLTSNEVEYRSGSATAGYPSGVPHAAQGIPGAAPIQQDLGQNFQPGVGPVLNQTMAPAEVQDGSRRARRAAAQNDSTEEGQR